MRSRIPLILAGLLIIALMATIGLAAFTPGGSDPAAEDAEFDTLDVDLPISGRVASAVLALAVAPVRGADLATSTTVAVAEPGRKLLPPESGVYHGAFPDFGPEEDIVTTSRLRRFTSETADKPITWAYFSDNWFDGIRFPRAAVQRISASGAFSRPPTMSSL